MFVLGQAAVAGVIAATTWAAGTIVVFVLFRAWPAGARPHGPHGPHGAPLSWALTMALGFAALGQLFMLVGMAGMLRKPVVLAIAIGIHLAALPAWRRLLAGSASSSALSSSSLAAASGSPGLSGSPGSVLTSASRARVFGVAAVALTVAVVVAAALPAFLLTLYPPLGFDQTMYHLPFARAFAASGGLPFLPALRYPMFPPLSELLNAAVLMFAGDVATQATGWVALVACAGLAYAWARDFSVNGGRAGRDGDDGDDGDDGGDDRGDRGDRGDRQIASLRAGGWLAAAIIAGSPIALYLAASGYVEPLLALMCGGSLYAAEQARIKGDARWLVIAGILAGSAASVKYLGLYFIPVAVTLSLRRVSWRMTLRDVVIYGVAAMAALLLCYGRLIMHTGNPVFPFFPELFGANLWAEPVIMGPRGAERWILTLTRLWDVTFRREAIGGLPHFSPAFVLAVPIIAVAAWRHHRVRLLLLIAVGYFVAAPTHAHYLFTIAVLWSALAGASAAALLKARKYGPHLLIVVAVLLACGGEAYAVYRLYRLGLPPVTSEGRERLLAEQRPLYPAIAWLNRTAGPVTLYAINAELMVDYASGTLLGDYNGPASFDRMEARVRGAGSVATALDAIGASHLLVPADASFWSDWAARDPRLTRVYDDGHAALYRVAVAPTPAFDHFKK